MSHDGISKIGMPKWGLSMEEGKLVAWLVEVGTELKRGSDVAEVETEKINGVVESPADGKLRRRVCQVGETLPVGALIGVIADDSVPEEEVDSYIAEFQSSFQPTDADDDGGSQTESISVDGLSLNYSRSGDAGETVLLLHGFGGELNNWLFNVDALAATHSVISLDLPGHGGSAKDVGDGSIPSFIMTLAKFLDAIGVDRTHLVAHSFGGAIASGFAVMHADRVLSLTLIGSVGFGQEIDGSYIDGFIDATSRRELKPQMEKLFADPSVVTRKLVDDTLRLKRIDGVSEALRLIADETFAAGRQSYAVSAIPSEVPTLVIWGAEDKIVPASHASSVAAHAQITVLEGQGHSPQMEASGATNLLISQFLASVDSDT